MKLLEVGTLIFDNEENEFGIIIDYTEHEYVGIWQTTGHYNSKISDIHNWVSCERLEICYEPEGER